MSGEEEREPLWASSLPHQPGREFETVFREPEPEPADRPHAAEAAPQAHAGGLLLVLALGALGVAVALLLAVVGREDAFALREVPSYWGETAMRCDTLRLEDGGRALEVFECRATGDAGLPTGTYTSPDSQWTSDLTRQDAVLNAILIDDEGEAKGVALY